MPDVPGHASRIVSGQGRRANRSADRNARYATGRRIWDRVDGIIDLLLAEISRPRLSLSALMPYCPYTS